MVYKSPKRKILGKQLQKKTPSLRVHVEKLDDNVYEAYRNRLIGTYDNPIPVKEERTCIFSSELDLDEHTPSHETNTRCQCSYCSPYHEMKIQNYKQYLDSTEDQENVGHRYPYLSDLVHESVDSYVQAPVAVQTSDAETQTAPVKYAFTCKECKSQFNQEFYYELHLAVHARRLYECAFCNATYTDDKKLQSHILVHMNRNCFECVDCNCVFANKKCLIKHMATHNKNMFECAVCKAQFQTDKGLQHHKKSHASSGKMIHVFRVAKTQSEPIDELVVETESANVYEEPPVISTSFFKCDKCNLQFKNAGNLARHSVIHNRTAGIFLHFCNVCGARFRSNNHLVCHKRYAHK